MLNLATLRDKNSIEKNVASNFLAIPIAIGSKDAKKNKLSVFVPSWQKKLRKITAQYNLNICSGNKKRSFKNRNTSK